MIAETTASRKRCRTKGKNMSIYEIRIKGDGRLYFVEARNETWAKYEVMKRTGRMFGDMKVHKCEVM